MPWNVSGGGSVAVWGSKEYGKMNNVGQLNGHKGFVNDLQFSPFHDNLLATASVDATVKIWLIPENGVSGNVTQSDIELVGHTKKVSLLHFHPSAEFTLASAGFDGAVKIWDVQNETAQLSYDNLGNHPWSL